MADTDAFAQQIVLGTPEITNLTPGDISTQGGAVITIRGRSFTQDSLVVVAGEVITDVQIQDTQTITLVAPELPSGLTTVTVQHRGGIAQTSLFVEPFPFDQLSVGHLTTVAGGTTFTGDGFNATAAFLSSPAGIAIDSDGNLFIADEVNGRIRRVDATTGIMTTVAGNGEAGCAGNQGLATAGALAFPAGVVVDASGNLLIAARDCTLIYKVDVATGIMTWLAGRRVGGFSGDGGPALEAHLDGPQEMALDSDGNLLISDRGNHRIRRVDVATGIITTVAGTGEAGISGDGGPATEATLGFPRGVILDGAGNLLFSGSNNRIRRVDATTGILTTVSGMGEFRFSGDGGPATEASLTQSLGLLVDGIGNLFVSDAFNNRIRKIDVTTGIITTVAGTGEGGLVNDGSRATEASLNNPRGLLVNGDDNLLIGDSGNFRIRRVDATTGIINTVAGNGEFGFTGDGGPALEAKLFAPTDVAMDEAGNLFIVDEGNQRIRAVRGVAQPEVSPGIGPGPPLTNLEPFQPSDWSDVIVVSNMTGTNTDSEPLSSTDTLFADYAMLNDGPVPTDVRFDNTLMVDGEEVFSSFSDPSLEPAFFTFFEDLELGPLSPGAHTLTLVVDSTSQIAETDESDNSYTRTVVIPGAPEEVTISVTKQLLYSVSITANGSGFGSVSASETREILLDPLASLDLSWNLNRPTVDGHPIGDAMGGSYSTIDDPSGTLSFTIDNVIGDSTYFVPLIDNETGDGLLMSVNMGLASENRCDCVVSESGQNVRLGYYRLFSNSNVRGYRTGSDYTGPYIFLGHDETVSPDGNLESLVESESGATSLRTTTAP